MMLESQPSLGRPRKQHGKRTLATVLRERGVLSTAHAVEVALQVCDALSSANAHGVVHGSLDVGCIRLHFTPEGGPRDVEIFTLDAEAQNGDALFAAAFFVEPERHSVGPVDARADVWALGGLLYASLVGVAPPTWPAGPALVPESVPRGLAIVIDACLGVDPASRPQTVDDVAEKIASFASWPPDHFARLAERRERRESAERSRQDLERRGLGDMPSVLDKLDEAAVARARRPTTEPVRVELVSALPALVDFDDEDEDEEVLSTLVQEETVRMEPVASPLSVASGLPTLPVLSAAPVLAAPAEPRLSPASVFGIFAVGAFALCLGGGYVGYLMSAKTSQVPRVVAAPLVPASVEAVPVAAHAASGPEIPTFVPSALPEAPPVTPASLPEAKP